MVCNCCAAFHTIKNVYDSLNTWHPEGFELTPPDEVQRRNPDLTAVQARGLFDRQPGLRGGRSHLVIVLVEINVHLRRGSRKVIFVVADEIHPVGNLVIVDVDLHDWFGQDL